MGPGIVNQMKEASRRHPVVAAFAMLLATAAIVVLFRPELGAAVAQPLVPIASVVAGVTGLRDARRLPDRRRRLPWMVISAGYLAAMVGIAAFVVLSVVSDVGAFGPMDIPIFVGYLMLIGGMLAQPQVKESRSYQLRVMLDAAVGAISVATVLWIWFIGDLIASLGQAPVWHQFAGVAYPALDVAGVVVIMVTFLRRTPQRFDVRLLFVALGLVSQVAADLSFLQEGLGRSFDEATPNYELFLAAFFFFVVGSMIAGDAPATREYAERVELPWWPIVAPYGWTAVMVALLVVETRATSLTSRAETLLASTLVVGGLVVARQFVAIRENRQLVERERKALISTISHELRTPLTAMVGFLDLITGDQVELAEDERAEMLVVVDQQARYLSRIVSDLVLLARGKSDQIELETAVVDVHSVVDRAATAMDTGMNDVHVMVPTGLRADVDGDRLQQAIVNLLSNAVRYGGDERALIASTDGDDLVIEVHDNGPGVPKRFELAIWERFERGANRLNSAVPGSGVGLAIVEAIARAHRGSVGYRRSEILGGACFTLRFPGSIVTHAMDTSEPNVPSWNHEALRLEQVGQTPDDRPFVG